MTRPVISLVVALSVAFSSVFAPAKAFAEADKEYLIKAAFIYNFVKFIEWPASKAAGQQHIAVCVLGDGPMRATGEVFRAASTDSLALTLSGEANLKNIASRCQIVFISQSEEGKIAEILPALKGHPILTVSDVENFAEMGGMIGFVTNDNKVKIEVNKKAMSVSGIRIDAQLLEIAYKVIDK